MATTQRNVLLDGAATYVLEHGFAGLSLRPMARALGTSDRMLVYHFGSKEQLIREAMEHLSARLAALIGASPVPGVDAGDIVRMLWGAFRSEVVAPFIGVYLELFALSLHEPALYGEMVASLTRTWITFMERLLAPTSIPAGERATAALQILATLDGLFIVRQATKDSLAADQAAEQFASRIGALFGER